jgi:hypothetical protein
MATALLSALKGAWGYIVAGLVAVGAVVGIYAKGRNTQKKISSGEAAKEKLKQAEGRNENLKTAKDISDTVSGLPASDVRKRLQDKYGRD